MTIDRNFKWKIVQRWQEYRSEEIVNILRMVCIIIFYLVELINFHGLKVGPVEFNKVVNLEFHKWVSLLAYSWGGLAVGIFFSLRRGIFPAFFKYLTTGMDLVLLTALLLLAEGAKSPLIVCFFLVILLSGIRMNLYLVRFSALGAILSYWFLNEYSRWRDLPLPPPFHLLIFTSALALAGIILGQLVRQIRSISEEYCFRLNETRGEG